MVSFARLRPFSGLILTPIALFGAYCASRDAQYAYLREVDPVAAWSAKPDDVTSLVRVLDNAIAKNPERPISPAEARHVRNGLDESPLNRGALRILAMEAASRNDNRKEEQGMLLSDALSRRDALTQLWLIEHSVGKDDVPGALRHYHRALAVHPELGEVLLPILANALSEPSVRIALEPYVSRIRPWPIDLLNVAIEKADPRNIALLLLPIAHDVRGAAFDSVRTQLLAKLALAGEFSLATHLVKAVWPDAVAGVTSFPVGADTTDPRIGALGWDLFDTGGIVASQNGAGGFDVKVESLSSGVFASRLIPVQGGSSYRFEHVMKSPNSGSLADWKWEAHCVPSGPGSLAWERNLSNVSGRFSAVIVVPRACKGLLLRLTTRGSESSNDAISFENLSWTLLQGRLPLK
jgi:hypothetical protein